MDIITSQMRLIADDSSLFTGVKGINETHETLVKDLHIVTDWAHQWKMVFNPDITKQAIEVIFSVKQKCCTPGLNHEWSPHCKPWPY